MYVLTHTSKESQLFSAHPTDLETLICMLPSTNTYSWHFNVRCMQMDSLIFHSSNYIASKQARSAKVSWNVEFLKILFPYPSAFSNKNEKRIWWQVRRRGRVAGKWTMFWFNFFFFSKTKTLGYGWLTDMCTVKHDSGSNRFNLN